MYPAGWLEARARELDLALKPDQAGRLSEYARLLLFWSQRINLVGPRAKARLWEEHLAPCLRLAAGLAEPGLTADLGSGAGLPGLVLACLAPERPIHLFEARAKRSSFLATAAVELGLDRVRVLTGRVPQDAPAEVEGAYGLVVSRALSLAQLLGPAAWLLAPEGRLAALKGARARLELEGLQPRLDRGGWRILGLERFSLYDRTHCLVRLARSAA